MSARLTPENNDRHEEAGKEESQDGKQIPAALKKGLLASRHLGRGLAMGIGKRLGEYIADEFIGGE